MKRPPAYIRRLRYNPTAPQPQPGLWILPAAVFLAGLLLAWASWNWTFLGPVVK